MTEEQRAIWEEWLSGRPPAVRAIAEKYPGHVCYRGAEGRGHYIITAYDEPLDFAAPITVKVAHGADSFLPGITVFGVNPETLTKCDCGEWDWPSHEQATGTHDDIEAFKAAVDAAGLKILPGLKLEPK